MSATVDHKNNSDIIEAQKNYLRLIKETTGINTTIKLREGGTPEGEDFKMYTWRQWNHAIQDATEPVYTCGILPTEVVFDADADDWDALRTECGKLKAHLDKIQIPYQMAYSGGDGLHFHIFIDPNITVDEDMVNSLREHDVDYAKILRKTAADCIIQDAKIDDKKFGVDWGKINFSAANKGSQVRTFGTTRENGKFKTLITEIPAERPDNLPLVFPEKIKLWNIEHTTIKKTLRNRLATAVEKARQNNEYTCDDVDLTDSEYGQYPCIKSFKRKGINLGRYYAGMATMLISKQCGYDEQSTRKNVNAVLKIDPTLADNELELREHNIMTAWDSDYHVSCSKIKDIFGHGYCNFSKCPLGKKIIEKNEPKTTESDTLSEGEQAHDEHIQDTHREKANNLLKNGNPLEYIKGIVALNHVGDVALIEGCIASVVSTSISNSNGVHVDAKGLSGKGKSHAMSTIAHLTPEGKVVTASQSAKSLFYTTHPEGTIYFQDDAVITHEAETTIKQCTTNYQMPTVREIVDGGAGNTMEGRQLYIAPRATHWLNSVDSQGTDELLNRIVSYDIDITTEQDIAVFEMSKKIGIGEKNNVLKITDDVLICRGIFEDVCKDVSDVIIPYAMHFKAIDISNRRNPHLMQDFIRASAKLNYRQRVINDKGEIEANFDDFTFANEHMMQIIKGITTKLTERERTVLKIVCDACMIDGQACLDEGAGAYTADIVRQSNYSETIVSQVLRGRRGSEGLLMKVLTFQAHDETINEQESTMDRDGDVQILKTKNKRVKRYTVNPIHANAAIKGQSGIMTFDDEYSLLYAEHVKKINEKMEVT